MCIDAVPLLFRSAGVKNYLYHWIRHLDGVRSAKPFDLRLFPYLGLPGHLDHERSVSSAAGTFGRLALWHGLNLVPNHLLDWIAPAADVFHASKLLNPPRRASLTATLHDATCWLMPELHTPANVAAEKGFAERIWKRAAGLIAVSECTRQDAVRVLGLDPRRIEVVHHGVDDAYFEVSSAQAEAVRRRFGLDRDYILFVGTIEPRKNLSALLDSYLALPAELRAQFQLVVAGPTGWSSDALLGRLGAASPDIRYLGYVPEGILPALFAGASLFAYVSLYEGFGFPVAQAMAAGVAVLTSAVSALPEIAGDAAEFVDPYSRGEIEFALRRLLTSPARRAALASAGRLRAQRYRWERCAAESVRFFARVAGKGGA